MLFTVKIKMFTSKIDELSIFICHLQPLYFQLLWWPTDDYANKPGDFNCLDFDSLATNGMEVKNRTHLYKSRPLYNFKNVSKMKERNTQLSYGHMLN